MSTHHCCEPTHRDYDEKMRRMRRELQEARSRADWSELNEGILADRLDEARQEIERLRR